MTKRFLKIGAMIGAAAFALILVAGLHTTGTAHAAVPTATPTANPNEIDVTTGAHVVGGGGAQPTVTAKWELPDMQTATGFQYAASPATDLNNNNINDADDDPTTAGMQMAPNLCDEPSERSIQYWIVAEEGSTPTNLSTTWDKVYEPLTHEGKCFTLGDPLAVPPVAPVEVAPVTVDGQVMCYKYQVDPLEMTCADLGTFNELVSPSVTTLGAALNAAVDTSQLTLLQAQTLVQRCYKHEVRVWLGTRTLAHHQPAGTYVVRAIAQDLAANVSTLRNTFTVLPVIGLRIDFSTVDWTSILPGQTGRVSGNEILDGPNSTTPTIKDCGNVNMNLTLEFSPMINTTDPTESITSFDAGFMGQTVDPIAADTEVTFNNCYIPCHPKELDLSVHPTSKLPPGVYAGTLDVTGGYCYPDDNPIE